MANSISADLALEARACCGERVDRNIFIYMDSLGVLAEVVEAGEAP